MVFSKFIFVASTTMEIVEKCSDDWYIPRTSRFSRRQLLTLVFVCKDVIRQATPDEKNVTKPKYDDALMELGESGSSLHAEVKSLDWQAVRHVLRSMLLKYKNEKSHTKFETYVSLSRTLWRNSLKY